MLKNAAQMRWLIADLEWYIVPSKFFTLCLYKASHRHLESLEIERRERDKMMNMGSNHCLPLWTFMFVGQYPAVSCVLLVVSSSFWELQSSQE